MAKIISPAAGSARGCDEYNQLSRRGFLRGAGAITAAAVTAPMWLPRVAMAKDDNSARDIMVSIYMRGGADSLSVCVPFGEGKNYYDNRPTIAIPENKVAKLTDFFGFAPSMAALLPAYQAGNLLVVHATGADEYPKSHFDSQRYMESGASTDSLVQTGWLGRHLAATAPIRDDAPLRALSFSNGLARTLSGSPLALPIPDPANFALNGDSDTAQKRIDFLKNNYQNTSQPVRSAALNTEGTINLLKTIDFANYRPAGGVVYPDTGTGYAFMAAAALIRADVGVEALHIDTGGWDTHENQDPNGGYFAYASAEFAGALAAFHADTFGRSAGAPGISLVAVSEFGRGVVENASRGTDHGHGSAMLILGDGIQGGQVLTKWPGLSRDQWYDDADLAVTLDYRQFLSEIVEKRLGNPNVADIFPGFVRDPSISIVK